MTTVKKTRGNKNIPPGPGRPKGTPNKVTADIKGMILTALSNVGGASYLEERANDPKTAAAFLGLVGKVLPMTIANEPGSEFRISVIERKIVRPTGN